MTTTVLKPVSATDAERRLRSILEYDEKIKELSEFIDQCKAQRDGLLSDAIRDGITEGGNYEMLAKPRITRTVNVERFAAMYPDAYAKMMEMEMLRAKMNAGKSITVKAAETVMSKEELDPVCDLKTTITYSVVKKYNDGTEDGR